MSKLFTFEPGVRYMLHGVAYLVCNVLSDGSIAVKNLAISQTLSQRIHDLWQHWEKGTLLFAWEGNITQVGMIGLGRRAKMPSKLSIYLSNPS